MPKLTNKMNYNIDSSRRYTQFLSSNPLVHESVNPRAPANISLAADPNTVGDQGQPNSTGSDFEKSSTGTVVAVRSRGNGEAWRNYREVCYLPRSDASLAVSNRNRRVHVRKLDLGKKALDSFYMAKNVGPATGIVEVLDVLEVSGLYHIVLEEMPLSLYNVVQCAICPSQSELVAIMAQVLDGLVFLEKHNLGHGSLDCHNVYANLQGHVKLGNQELFKTLTANVSSSDARAIHKITIRLMQKDDGPDIKDQDRWRNFHNFVKLAASSNSVVELRKEGILSHQWTKESLIALFALADENRAGNFRMIANHLQQNQRK